MTQEYVEALLQVPGGHWELILASTRQYTPWKQDVLKKKEKKSSTRARIPTGNVYLTGSMLHPFSWWF